MNLCPNFVRICTLFFLIYTVTSCDSPKTKSEETTEEIESLGNVPFERNNEHDTCLLIAHQISEYDVWKASFDLAQPLREDQGIKALHVYRERMDTNLAFVFAQITNFSVAKKYITSEQLQNQMKEAGVMEAVNLFWMTKELTYNKPITDTLLMFMSFKVISYDRWEKAFLNDYREEPSRNFQVLNVLRGIDDQNNVNMIFAVNDPEYVQKMESNNAFRAKMLASGVISYPVIYKFNEVQL